MLNERAIGVHRPERLTRGERAMACWWRASCRRVSGRRHPDGGAQSAGGHHCHGLARPWSRTAAARRQRVSRGSEQILDVVVVKNQL